MLTVQILLINAAAATDVLIGLNSHVIGGDTLI